MNRTLHIAWSWVFALTLATVTGGRQHRTREFVAALRARGALTDEEFGRRYSANAPAPLAALLRACLKTPPQRRVGARGLQEWATIALGCRPGAFTGRVFKQALRRRLAENLGCNLPKPK